MFPVFKYDQKDRNSRFDFFLNPFEKIESALTSLLFFFFFLKREIFESIFNKIVIDKSIGTLVNI